PSPSLGCGGSPITGVVRRRLRRSPRVGARPPSGSTDDPRALVNAVGWVLLGVFLALLVAGGGVAIWAAVRPAEELSGRAGILAGSLSVALAGTVGAFVVAMWAPGSGGGGMMGGIDGMAGMMGGSSSRTCPSQQAGASAPT